MTWRFSEHPLPYTRMIAVDCDATNENMARFLLRLAEVVENTDDVTLMSVTTKSSEYGEDCWRIEAIVEGPTVDAFLEEVLGGEES